MSYDIDLVMPDGSDVALPRHTVRGGTYEMGGSTSAHFNITYNYSALFRSVLGSEGIRGVYGMTARAGAEWLRAGAAMLLDETPAEDYWAATHGNARRALVDLAYLADLCPPDAVFKGD